MEDEEGAEYIDPEIWVDVQPLINGKLMVWHYEGGSIKTKII